MKKEVFFFFFFLLLLFSELGREEDQRETETWPCWTAATVM